MQGRDLLSPPHREVGQLVASPTGNRVLLANTRACAFEPRPLGHSRVGHVTSPLASKAGNVSFPCICRFDSGPYFQFRGVPECFNGLVLKTSDA